MGRFGALVVALFFAAFAAPASANTIANFTLDNVTFIDGGTASGSFSLDLTSGLLTSSSITTTTTFFIPGALYLGGIFNLGFPTTEVSLAGVSVGGTSVLTLNVLTPPSLADLLTLPTLAIASGGEEFSLACVPPACPLPPTRPITSGSVKTDSVVETTPLPAALPLFVSALGGMGVLGWRRKRSLAAAS